jgi:signal transduction histidine kinase/CheY-like chemotaxis protein
MRFQIIEERDEKEVRGPMFGFFKNDDTENWRGAIEYPINICAFLLAIISLITLTDIGQGAFDIGRENTLTVILTVYPVLCLLRLAYYHFKKPKRNFGWVCAVSDLLFVFALVFQNGFDIVHIGLIYCVITLHGLRFNASQVLSLGVMAVMAVIGLGVFGIVPTNPGVTLVSLAAFCGIFSFFAMKAESVLEHNLANKLAAENIKHAQKTVALKSKVINQMGSELDSPMKSVLGVSKALRKTELTTEQKQYITVLENSSEALLSAIDNILDFTQMEKGALTSKLEHLNLDEMLKTVANMFGPKARRKNLDLLIDIEPNSKLALTGYEKRLRQIINSLVDNAIKFTHEGYVVVRVSSKAINSKLACLSVSVEDSGIGLTDTQRDALLKNHTSTDTAKSDRGLGLKIVQMLLGVQGEALNITSKPGEGSRFSFELHMPYRDVKEAPTPFEASHAAVRSVKTLIVNDQTIESDILQKQLNSAGMMPQIVNNAQDACLAINTAHNNGTDYVLAIIDYHMPEFDGLKLADLIRSREELNEMKMLVVSSSDIPQIEKAFSEMDSTQYLHKPYTQSEVQAAIVSLMRGNKQAQTSSEKKVA